MLTTSKPSTSSRKREIDEDYVEGDAQNEPDDDDDDDYVEKPKRKSSKEKKKKEKPEKKHKEPKEKKTPKRRSSLSFEDALGGAPKSSKKKHDPKKDKPMFVGGLPMAAIQDGPVVPNAYNYDPMAEIMKLGTGQLQSAYRKSKLVGLLILDDILFISMKGAQASPTSSDLAAKHQYKTTPQRPSPSSIPPPRTGFMPRLHDVSPSASTPSKSPMTSPAPRRMQATSVDGTQRSPAAEFSPAVSRASRASFSEYGRTGPIGQVSPSLSRNGTPLPPAQAHTSPIAPFSSPKPPPLPARTHNSPSEVRDDAQRGLGRPQDIRKARFADNPVTDVSPPPAATTPPLMPSPAQALRSPDLPPVFTPATTATAPTPASTTPVN
ncbi:unnamed protein product, partial [Strongylus vulgaris]